MPMSIPERIANLRTTAATTAADLALLPDRARTFGRVVRQSGLLFEFGLTGLRFAAGVALKGGRNPSLIFAIHGANSPEKTALLWRDCRVTYGELDDRMNRVAAVVLRLAIRSGIDIGMRLPLYPPLRGAV